MHDLLSESRRQGTADDDDRDGWAVLGASVLDNSVRAGHGVPLRYSGPETVKAILEPLAEADLRCVYLSRS